MVATVIGTDAVVIYGTAAEMLSPAGQPIGSLFIVDSGAGQGLEYSVGTDGEWFNRGQIELDPSGNPAGNTTESPVSFIKYSDATYEYFCEAAPTTARSTAAWRVLRKTIATGDMVYAGTGLAEHAATDLSTVGALTYTLGT